MDEEDRQRLWLHRRRGGGAVGEEDRWQLQRRTGGAIVEASKDES